MLIWVLGGRSSTTLKLLDLRSVALRNLSGWQLACRAKSKATRIVEICKGFLKTPPMTINAVVAIVTASKIYI